MEINIFTDGSTLNNQVKGNRNGGSGVFFSDNDIRNMKIPLKETKNFKVTNQVAELLACIKGIEQILDDKSIDKIIICTDSMYTINSMTKWAKKWEKNNWVNSKGKTVENLELIKQLYNYTTNRNISYKHIRAHKTKPSKLSEDYYYWYGNYMADKLAVEAAKSIS